MKIRKCISYVIHQNRMKLYAKKLFRLKLNRIFDYDHGTHCISHDLHTHLLLDARAEIQSSFQNCFGFSSLLVVTYTLKYFKNSFYTSLVISLFSLVYKLGTWITIINSLLRASLPSHHRFEPYMYS